MKVYDKEYFDYWYRDRGFHDDAEVLDFVRTLVAEVVKLHGPILRILDVGCGEGRFQPAFTEVLPDASYLGIDSSRHCVEHFGSERNVNFCTFGGMGEYLVGMESFDLIICVNVLEYVDLSEIWHGLNGLVAALRGVAYLRTNLRPPPEADEENWHYRGEGIYPTAFLGAGLVPVVSQYRDMHQRLETEHDS